MTTKEFYENNKGLQAKYEKAEMVRIVGYTIHSVIVVHILRFDIKDLQFCSKDFYVDKDFVNNNEKIRLVDLIDLSTIKDKEQGELNLCELLKGCDGMAIYSPMFGECIISQLCDYIVISKNDANYVVFENNGKYCDDGECLLFPSRENRDWSTFKKPIKQGRLSNFALAQLVEQYTDIVQVDGSITSRKTNNST